VQAPLIPSDLPVLRRALAVSVLVHLVLGAVGHFVPKVERKHEADLVDIEVAPLPPAVEALPEEVARVPEQGAPGNDETDDPSAASTTPRQTDEGIPADAGVDAPPDAPPDAPIDAPPDAPIDAPPKKPDAAPLVAEADAGVADAAQVALADAGTEAGDDAAKVAIVDAGVAEHDAATVAIVDAGVAEHDAAIVAIVDAGVAEHDAAIVAIADAGVAGSDAAIVAVVDAGVDAALVAAVDAGAGAANGSGATVASGANDAGAGSGATVASGANDAGATVASGGRGDAGATGNANIVGAAGSGAGFGSGSGAGSGSGVGSSSIAFQAGSGSGVAGQTNEPAVDGAPTTAGTAANLLTYFPQGHMLTVLIRFDRLRGTEWAAQAEKLIAPLPDYQFLFGGQTANVTEKLETLVVSTFSPRDINATTLVGRTLLGRAGLRDMLSAAAPVTWSTTKSGLLGKRTQVYRGDKRVFLSPFKGWFLLAPPKDLGSLAPAPGDQDAIVATAKQPAWLSNIRTIEKESGTDARGPSLVVTLALGGKRFDLGDNDFGLGIKSLPTPDRVSLAMELVKQGWLVRGNMRFVSEKEAKDFIAAAETVRDRVADSTVIQLAMGKPLARVVKNLSFARTGGRVSYVTSISIADARVIFDATAQQLDGQFRP